jgi:two-component system response regulator RegX3
MHNAYRIIIAEDDEDLASLLTRLILRRYPTAVLQSFGNGLEALAAYDHAGADLLFVDHRMPGMDGSTLIRTVRARGDSVPMIGMSGDPSLDDVYMAAGATEFEEGGDLIEQLSAILRRFLPPALHSAQHVHERTIAEPYSPNLSGA